MCQIFVRFDAGMLKLQQMIKWDVFLGHGVDIKYRLSGITVSVIFSPAAGVKV